MLSKRKSTAKLGYMYLCWLSKQKTKCQQDWFVGWLVDLSFCVTFDDISVIQYMSCHIHVSVQHTEEVIWPSVGLPQHKYFL